MGSDLYSIRVLEKDDRMVSLHVRCVHPDVLYVAADPGFALLALLDAVPYRETAPLSDEVSFDDAMSGVWASQYARGFVKEVCARDVRDPLPAEAEEDDEHPYWESEQWLSWTLDVEVAHPAWIEHVHKGGCWDSTAFSPVGDYAEHAPIEPTPDAPMEDPEGMFVWVPRECYAETAQWWSELPPLLEMPAYSETYYLTESPIPIESLQPGSPWVGRPVRVSSEFGCQLGALARIDAVEGLSIASMAPHWQGLGGYGSKSVSTVVPKAKRRTGEVLTYQTVLKRAATTITKVTCEGDRAVFVLRVPPDGRALPIETETDALGLLIESCWVRRDSELSQDRAPLLQALLEDGVAREIESAHRVRDILPRVAKNYVASVSLEGPTPTKEHALDSLSHAEARAALEAPWPTATVEVVVREARWLNHLQALEGIFGIRGYPLSPPVIEEPEAEPAAPLADERVILWRGGRNQVMWMVERFGRTLRRQSGRRDRTDRKESEVSCASVEAAMKQFQREVAKKLKDGYERLQGGSELQARIEGLLGVTFASLSPPRVATCADPAQDVSDTSRLRARDVITGVGVMGDPNFNGVLTLEELAAALLRHGGPSAYVWFRRPASGTSASVSVRLEETHEKP